MLPRKNEHFYINVVSFSIVVLNYISVDSHDAYNEESPNEKVPEVSECYPKKQSTAERLTQPAGFEPARAEPNGFRVHRLNHSATTAVVILND